MKALVILSAAVLVGCGVKGPPERPSGAQVDRTARDRLVIRGNTPIEAPATSAAAPKPERRFILDGLL